MSATVELIAAHEFSGDSDTFAATGASIGAAASDRGVGVIVCSRSTTGQVLTGVTIGGVAAPIVGQIYDGASGTGNSAACAALAVPSGTTANIVATFATTQLRAVIYVYRLTAVDLDSALAVVASVPGTTTHDLDLAIPIAGVVIAGGMGSSGTNPTPTWTGLTQNHASLIEGVGVTAASATGTPGEFRDIGLLWSSGGGAALAVRFSSPQNDCEKVISRGDLWLPMQEAGAIANLGGGGRGGAVINGTGSPTAATLTVPTGPTAFLPNAFDFDAAAAPTDLRINVTLPPAADWFCSYWLRPNDVGMRTVGQKYIDNSNWEWSAGHNSNGIHGTASRSSGTVEAPCTFGYGINNWYHLAVSRTGSDYTQWINGVLHSTGSIAQPPITASLMVIGNSNHITAYASRFRGRLAGFYWRASPGTLFDAAALYAGPQATPTYSPRRLRRRPTSFDLGAAL